jgi:hypothetical protein
MNTNQKIYFSDEEYDLNTIDEDREDILPIMTETLPKDVANIILDFVDITRACNTCRQTLQYKEDCYLCYKCQEWLCDSCQIIKFYVDCSTYNCYRCSIDKCYKNRMIRLCENCDE